MLFERVDVPSGELVGGEDDAFFDADEAPVLAGVFVDVEAGAEVFYFAGPVEQERGRDDEQMGAALRGIGSEWFDDAFFDPGKKGDGLQCFAQPHVIGQAGSEAVFVEEGEP